MILKIDDSRIIKALAIFLRPLVLGEAAAGLSGIPRFNRVADGFFRGGQPDAEGFAALRNLGIKTVINLRLEGDREKEVVESFGMNYVHIPTTLGMKGLGVPVNRWKRIPDQAVRAFFAVLRNPSNYPIFVHCHQGKDRTGVMVGFYRIAFERWDAEGAYSEARRLGMSRWFRGLRDQLYEFATVRAGRPLLSPIGSSH